MILPTRSITGISEAKRPQGLRGFARVALMSAWVVFWLNTALFPCYETVAAAIGGYPDSVSQSVSNAQPMHNYGAAGTYSERSDPSPYPPCGYTLSTGPASVGMHALPATDHSPLEWFAIDAPVPSLITASHAENLAPRGNPPPPLRLYLRTLRLLI